MNNTKKQIQNLAAVYKPYADDQGLYGNAPRGLVRLSSYCRECGFTTEEFYEGLCAVANDRPSQAPNSLLSLLEWAAYCDQIERLDEKVRAEKKTPPTELHDILTACYQERYYEVFGVIYQQLKNQIDDF